MIYAIFVFYFLIIFYIGYRAYLSTETNEDYVLGGRKLNAIITALGVGASDMSGWLMIALPGALYYYGFNHIWMPIGLFVGASLNWFFVAKKLRKFTIRADNSITIPEYLEKRFNDKTKLLRTLTAAVIIIFFTIYCSAGFVSSGLLFSSTFNISYHSAVLLGVFILVFYTAIGGFLAVNWIDVFQGSLMLLALIFLPCYIYVLITNSNPDLLQISFLKANFSNQFASDYFNFIPNNITSTNLLILLSTLAWGLGYFGQPHILVRFMAAESNQAIIKARRICLTWMFLALVGSMLLGYLGKILYINNPLSDPEQIFFAVVNDHVNELLGGWLLAAVLSCVLSTTSAQLILSSSALCEDIYNTWFNPQATDKELLNIGRISVVIVALFALLFAWDKHSSVLSIVGHSWAGLGASFGPVILFSLFSRTMTRNAAFWGILSGAFTVITVVILKYLFNIYLVYEIIPGFIVSSLVIYFISIFDTKNREQLSQVVDKLFEPSKN